MLNAVLAALHLLNIREEFVFLFFFLNVRICFWFWFLWVDGALKLHHKRYTLHAATEIRHRSDTDAVTKWTILPLYRPLVDLWWLKGFVFLFCFLAWTYTHRQEKKEKVKPVKEKGTRFNGSWSLLYADLCTRNNDGIRKCSFMVPEYIFVFYLAF